MRLTLSLVLTLVFTSWPVVVQAQKNPEREDDFVKAAPAVGSPLPELTVYSPDGTEFRTSDLRGHYTVLTFGCLT